MKWSLNCLIVTVQVFGTRAVSRDLPKMEMVNVLCWNLRNEIASLDWNKKKNSVRIYYCKNSR